MRCLLSQRDEMPSIAFYRRDIPPFLPPSPPPALYLSLALAYTIAY